MQRVDGRPTRKLADSEAAFPDLLPGSFVKLDQHPSDLPAFELIRCQGRRCWVRQQAWGPAIQWEVACRSLSPG